MCAQAQEQIDHVLAAARLVNRRVLVSDVGFSNVSKCELDAPSC